MMKCSVLFLLFALVSAAPKQHHQKDSHAKGRGKTLAHKHAVHNHHAQGHSAIELNAHGNAHTAPQEPEPNKDHHKHHHKDHDKDHQHHHHKHQLHHSGSPPAAAAAASDSTPYRQKTNGSTPTGWIQVGTPKKYLLVIFDTGSDKLVAKTWETVAAELASIDQGITGMVWPSELLYDHNGSSSYHRKYIKQGGHMVPQQSSITYGSGTAVTDVGSETVNVGNRDLSNFTLMEITADSLQMLHTSKGIAGVLGLQHMKNKSLGNSLFSRMRDAGKLSAFGYCRGSGNNGTFIWGDDSTEGTELEVIGQMHWAVKLGGVKVQTNSSLIDSTSLIAKKRRAAKAHKSKRGFPEDMQDDAGSADEPDVDNSGGEDTGADSQEEDLSAEELASMLKDSCPDSKCTAILDTGSNIIAGPSDAMTALTTLVDVKPDCSNFDKLPVIEMNLGGMAVKVQPSGYVMKVPMPTKPSVGDFADGQGEEGDFAHLEDAGEASFLAEKKASRVRQATHRRWKAVFARLNKDYGVDLRAAVDTLLKQNNASATNAEFMCMPALVPLDMKTKFGPLWVVGTPMMDSYYTRWSWKKDAPAPKVHLKPIEDAEVCNSEEGKSNDPTVLMRSEKSAGQSAKSMKTSHVRHRGPTVRLPEEISFPHWAKTLLHV